MNRAHLEVCASDDWRDMLRDFVIPFALAEARLGDRVLEVGPGPGRTTELLSARLPHMTAVEIDLDLARALATTFDSAAVAVVRGDGTALPFADASFSGAVSFTMLHHVPTAAMQDRLLAEVARVLAPRATFVVSDSMASDDLAAFHVDDVYNPVDPAGISERLRAVGFASVEVRSNEFGWAAHAVA